MGLQPIEFVTCRRPLNIKRLASHFHLLRQQVIVAGETVVLIGLNAHLNVLRIYFIQRVSAHLLQNVRVKFLLIFTNEDTFFSLGCIFGPEPLI